MKNKKGFTLIELLAVIVILAVIMVIAVPKILDVIENSKQNAAKTSASLYIDAINKNNSLAEFNKQYNIINDGTDKDIKLLDVKVKGNKPTSGFVTIKKTKVTSADLCVEGYHVNYFNSRYTIVGDCLNEEISVGERKSESILEFVKEYDIENDSNINLKVEDELYTLHTYNYDESQIWTTNMIFGNENDVASEDEYAKNMVVVKINGDLVINEGVNVTTYASENGYGGPKGLLIYVTGALTNNGTISMTARGAYAPGQEIYLYKNSNNSFEKIPSTNTNGGAGINRSPGCGGRGGSYSLQGVSNFRGGYATSYSGGSGAGGRYNSCGGIVAPSDIGGKGGGMSTYNSGPGTSGGAGNPGGSRSDDGGVGSNGTGGLLIIYANSFENNNLIESNGSNGGTGTWTSGGGSINIFTRNIINKGKINANGGKAGGQRGSSECYPSAGGAGSISIGNISTGIYIEYTE